jgi:rfaE bifunctional protein nucleotidyltransferase chain/domain
MLKHTQIPTGLIKSQKETVALSRELKRNGVKLVFTNGCFDIVHPGHVRFLEEASKYGDVLIVGINSDQSVKLLKGKDRPIIRQQDRLYVVSCMRFVNIVVQFGATSPLELIKQLRPDVLVKGGDYAIDEIVGKDVVETYGGEVLSLPFYRDYSTSSIVKKRRELKKA